MNGDGQRVFVNGCYEKGQFHFGHLEGSGTRTSPSGLIENGIFSRGCFVQGTRVLPDGTIEIGSFLDDQLSGTGERIFKDGTKEKGEFFRGCLWGPGTRTSANGREEHGEFFLM